MIPKTNCLVKILWLLSFCVQIHAQGGCVNEGILLPNGTTWYSEPCTQCHCYSGVKVCQSVECLVPECSLGEDLVSVPHECCPRCQPRRVPCIEGSEEYKHGATWSLPPCLECQCYNGTVSCEHLQCGPGECRHHGQEPRSSVQQCCPDCVSSGRPCKYESLMYEDGTIWSPISCTKCQCQNGLVQCYVAQCQSISCPLNHTLTTVPGQCCPTCRGNSCSMDGQVHESGTTWQIDGDACTHCSCMAGQINCFETKCPSLSCTEGQREMVLKGKCCPQCVSSTGLCTVKGGQRVPHGAEIKLHFQKCDANEKNICFCHHGDVKCTNVTCQRTGNCGHRMKLQTDDLSENGCGKCPKCVPDLKLCLFERRTRKDGETWSMGCSICECSEGRILCYEPVCPSCSQAFSFSPTVSLVSSRISPCCPRCAPVSCPSECLSCITDSNGLPRKAIPGHHPEQPDVNAPTPAVICRNCKEGFYLWEDRCFPSCNGSTFPRSGRCLPCHPTCLTCTESVPFRCTSCAPPLYLRSGQCVTDCGLGFYSSRGMCHPCHYTCEECSGASITECQGCPSNASLFNGLCVEECPPLYAARRGVCVHCQPHCIRCGFDDCLECAPGFWRQNGKCLDECEIGYFRGAQNECQECHPTCLACNAAGIDSCTSCSRHRLKLNTSCVLFCPPRTFRRDTTCIHCHTTCSECSHEGPDGCLKCGNPDQKVLPSQDQSTETGLETVLEERQVPLGQENWMAGVLVGLCIDACPHGYKLRDGVCLAPVDDCVEWDVKNGNVCLRCKEGFLTERNVCVLECSSRFYREGLTCKECSPHCATCSAPGANACESCVPWASLHTRSYRDSDEASEKTSKCLTKCPKGHYFHPKDLSCRMCDPSCEDCVTPSSGRAVCVKCKEANQVLQEEKCLNSCSKGYYYSEKLGHCDKCNSLCYTCSGPETHECQSCEEGLFLTMKNTCEKNLCQPGFTISEDGTCSQKCHDDCHSCFPDDLSTCTSCLNGKHLMRGKCVEHCPAMYFADVSNNGECKECHWACQECQGPTADDCVRCGTGQWRQENRCVTKCSDGFFLYFDVCTPCSGGCKKCESWEECLSCEPPYLLEKGHCVATCKRGSFSNIWEGECEECSANCRQCTMFECLECEKPLLSQNGQCVEKCDHNYFSDSEKLVCYYNVDTPHLFIAGVLNAKYDGLTSLNNSLVQVFDGDTQRERLSLIVTELPTNGDIFLLEKRGKQKKVKEGARIPFEAVEEGRIFFEYRKRESFHSHIKFRVSDGHFESETGIVTINVFSTYAPQVVILEPLIVRRREKKTITKDNLRLQDIDSPETVVIRVLDGPSLGKLTVSGNEKNSFTIKQLEGIQVAYEHSDLARKSSQNNRYIEDSFNGSDLILLQANDGYNYVNFMFSVKIVDSVKPGPVILKNRGAKVFLKEKVQITADLLQTKDLDSSDGDIVYAILPNQLQPTGKFIIVIPLPTIPSGFFNDGWIQMDESHLSRETTSFTQRDINEGRVWYVHSASSLSGGNTDFEAPYLALSKEEEEGYATDVIHFSVSDSGNPPNLLGDQTFIIQVAPLPQQPVTQMQPLPGVQFGITVLEGQAVTITPSHLAFSGVNSNDHLVYIITHPLGPNEGSLFHIDYPGLELRQFTQSDINDMKIIYMPPLEDIGEEERVISFKFIISDEMIKNQANLLEEKFTIKILPLKEEMSLLHPNPEIIVSSRGTVEVNPNYFHLKNSPSGEEVTVFLLEAPHHGSLSLNDEGQGGISQDFTEETETTLNVILSSRVLYSNNGSEHASDSAAFLFLGSSSEVTTRISFKILLEDNLEPRADKDASFILWIKEDETKILSSKIVHFLDFHSEDEQLVYTLSSQPAYGDLLITNDSGRTIRLNQTHKFIQADLSQGRLSYSSNVETGIDPVVDSILLNVTDPSNNALTNQVLRIHIHPVDNKAPTLKIIDHIRVKEGGRVALTDELFSFTDVDSTMSKLKLIVDVPPVFGYIMNSRLVVPEPKYRSNSPSLLRPEFSIQDLVAGKLHYIQSQHKHQEPTSDTFRIHLSDGINESLEKEVKINIELVNDETPVILGEQVSVERGGTITISNVSLFISDSDTEPENLVVTITQAPKHGTLHKKKSSLSSVKNSVSITEGDEFLFSDILQNLVFYSQDGSKATGDEMEIKVSDGVQETGGLLEFLVLPQKEKTPQILVNNPLLVQRGQKGTILPSILSATDEDSPNNDLVFVLTIPPEDGTLQLYEDQEDMWKSLSFGTKFLQRDISSGRLRYIHKNLKPEANEDRFQFNVQDPQGNVILEQSLIIGLQEDKIPPRITVNKGATVKESSHVVLSVDALSATDSEIDPMNLLFRITESPSFGQVELIPNPGKSIKLWTQRDMELGRVIYRHIKYSSAYNDRFHFEVSDGFNKVYRTFHIAIVPSDEIPPYLLLKPLTVQEGTRKNLSHYEIQAKDPDTSDDFLIFEIKKPPKWGKIQKISHNHEISDTKMFSMQDIYERRISYIHVGNSIANDSFTITLSDPVNKGYLHTGSEAPVLEPSTVFVVVLSVSRGTPVITTNAGIQYLERTNGKAQNTITSSKLMTIDDDSSPDQLIYKITQPPEYGVVRLKTHTRPIATFTQDSINKGHLYYELTSFNEDINRDQFVFQLSDQKLNTVSDVFLISWSWIVMAEKNYNISESDGVVQIFIKKMGNINQKSSVKCSLSTGSSHRGGRLLKRRKEEKASIIKEKKDIVPLRSTVEFGEGSTEKYCEIAIIDDDILEGKETFSVKLSSAKFALIGKPKKSIVTIFDEEDRPSLSFDSNHYTIEENEDFIFVPVKRSGDVQVAASAYCVTRDGTAIGTNTSIANANADYLSKYPEESSKVVFPPGVKLSTCDIKLVNDPNFELDETFELLLVQPSKEVLLNEINQTLITIKGPNDQSILGFKKKNYEVVERSRRIRITVQRNGTSLDHKSSVWCASKSSFPEQAKPNSDFMPFSKQITFQPGQDEAVFSINIIDDKGNPRYEGPESFVVFISTPQNATLNHEFAEASVTIIDDEDIPYIQFEYPEFTTKENFTVAKVPVVRLGDLASPSAFRCFTQQRSAKGGIDYIERPNSEDSTLIFPIGVSRVDCEVNLLDDLLFEKEEEFALKLKESIASKSQTTFGPYQVARITIEDIEDKPRVSFEKLYYSTPEPRSVGEISNFKVPLIRTGDTSKLLKVLVSSKEGSATGEINFKRLNQIVKFNPDVTREVVDISILHSPSRQWNKSFRIVLGTEETGNEEFGAIVSTTITIIDHHANEASVLPSLPVVVSLLHYETATEHYKEPASPGYPLICITACEEQHPEYSRTQQLCERTGFNANSQMKYSWEIAVPGEHDDSLMPFQLLTESTLFGNSSSKVLDSMFFARHFRVRCVVQPILENRYLGIPLRSKPVIVSSLNAICNQPGINAGIQSQFFIAKLSYINYTDEEHPNTVKIHVNIPHQDGMVPLISTLPLHNIPYLLTDAIYRSHHICSNLKPPFGFFESKEASQILSQGNARPHQWNEKLRKNETLALYRHLNLRTCTWIFTAYYSMSQLVDECGGNIISDFKVGSSGQSFLTVRVPLYLSYTFASPAPGWTSLDHRTELSVSLYYSTLLWNQGLHTQPSLTAKLQISRLYLNSAGRLVIELSTIARYRGQFVLSHPLKPEIQSNLISPPNLHLNFTLELLWSSATWDGPEQVWRATSEFTLRDYTGEYSLQLVPCTVFPSQPYEHSDPLECIPQNPVNFSLPLSIQQIQQPVPLVYSLNTNFQLFKNKDDFLLDPRKVDNLEEIDYKGSFGPSQTVYGRVLWHPNQDLKSAYQLIIQRVLLCTGADGYIPKYDPVGDIYNEGPQFGCIEESKLLKHRFLILDKEMPYSISNASSLFEASFTEEIPELDALNGFPGVDGFLLHTDGLYKINSGYQWFLQVLYTIGPSQGKRWKRESLEELNYTISQQIPENHTDLQDMFPPVTGIGFLNTESKPIPASLQALNVRNGTNMRSFSLSFKESPSLPPYESKKDAILFTSVLYVVLSLIFLVIVVLVVILLVRRHYSRPERSKVIVVRSLKNEREKDRRRDYALTKSFRPSGSPVTLNSESNLQTIKVKTLAVTVRNNLEEFGTEV